MHGVALHSHTLCKLAESVRWYEKVPLSIVVAVPRVGGLGTNIFHAVSGGALVMRARSATGGRSGTDYRKPRLGRCHIGASASGSGCTAPGDADVIPCHFAAPSRCHALPQAGGSTLCWLGLCLVLPTGWWEAKYMPHDPCDVA